MSDYDNSDISFNPWSWVDIFPALCQCTVGSYGQMIVDKHCQLLRDFGNSMGANEVAIDNAERLARGYDDLVIILVEPVDPEGLRQYDEILADESCYEATRLLDQSLRFAFRGQRNVHNTIILDLFPFRSIEAKYNEDEGTRNLRNRDAAQVVQQILHCLYPKVFIVCHGEYQPDFPVSFCSRFKDGNMCVKTFPNGHECIQVSSIHPMYFAKPDETAGGYGIVQMIAREYLFDFTMIAAANALIGRQISEEAAWDLANHAKGKLGFLDSGISFRRSISVDVGSPNDMTQKAESVRAKVIDELIYSQLTANSVASSRTLYCVIKHK